MDAKEYLDNIEAQSKTESSAKQRKSKSNKDMESSLALAADAQYQNGVALVRKVGEQSFLKGIEDEISKLLDSPVDVDFDAIAAKFQNASSKRLKSANSQPLILPAHQWLIDEEEYDDE